MDGMDWSHANREFDQQNQLYANSKRAMVVLKIFEVFNMAVGSPLERLDITTYQPSLMKLVKTILPFLKQSLKVARQVTSLFINPN